MKLKKRDTLGWEHTVTWYTHWTKHKMRHAKWVLAVGWYSIRVRTGWAHEGHTTLVGMGPTGSRPTWTTWTSNKTQNIVRMIRNFKLQRQKCEAYSFPGDFLTSLCWTWWNNKTRRRRTGWCCLRPIDSMEFSRCVWWWWIHIFIVRHLNTFWRSFHSNWMLYHLFAMTH